MPKFNVDFSQAELRVVASSPRLAKALAEASKPPKNRADEKRKLFAERYGASPEAVYKAMRGAK